MHLTFPAGLRRLHYHLILQLCNMHMKSFLAWAAHETYNLLTVPCIYRQVTEMRLYGAACGLFSKVSLDLCPPPTEHPPKPGGCYVTTMERLSVSPVSTLSRDSLCH